jgi:hypothetical protein
MNLAGCAWQTALRDIVSSFVVFSPFGLVIVLLKLVKVDSWLILGVSALLAAIYFVYVARTNEHIRRMLRQGR